MTMSQTNQEIVRGIITSPDVGTPGAGLLSPEQFEAFWVLAESMHPWAQIQDTQRKQAFTGTLNRIDFGDDVIEPASEAVDTGNFTEPDYSHVSFEQKKGRVAFSDSYEARDQAAEADHERTLVEGFTRAFGRSFQKLAWLGDESSTDKMLKLNDGWLKQMVAGGNVTDGSTINGGDLAADHFYAAVRSLPLAWQQRRNELKWAIGVTHQWVLEEYLSGRATGMGDQFLSMGPDGTMRILGIECVQVPSLTTDLVLTHPMNTCAVIHPRTFRLEKIDKGLEVQAADITAWIGFFHGDYVLREVEGIAVVTNLNPS
jgi:hypothetical protein